MENNPVPKKYTTLRELTPHEYYQIALAKTKGATILELAKQFNMSTFTICKALKKDVVKDHIKTIENDVLVEAMSELKLGLSKLTGKAIKALEKAIEDGNMMAVGLFFKGLGVGAEDNSKKDGPQNLTIVMPGATTEKPAIEIQSEVEDDSLHSKDNE